MPPPETSRPETPADAAPRSAPGAETPARRQRWLLVLGGALVLLVALVLLAPTLLAPVVRSRVVREANARLLGTTTLEDLSVSLGGHVSVTGLSVRDVDGRPVADVPGIEIRADVLALLGGRVVADVEVRAPQLHVRKGPDGRLNLQSLLRAPSPEPSSASMAVAVAATRDAPVSVADLPELVGHLGVSGGTVFLHEGDAVTELRELAIDVALEDLERPAPFTMTATLSGPGGAAGSVRLQGDVTAARDGLVDPARMRAHADYTLEGVRLDGLLPAASLFAPVDRLAGGLSGHGKWTWDGGMAVSGGTEIDLAGASVRTPALGPEARALPSCRLTAEARLDEAGSGTQTLHLQAGTLLDLRWDGSVTGAIGDTPALDGTLALDGRLDELQAATRGMVPLREGVDLAGALSLQARVGAALSPDGLVDASIDARFGIEDIVALETGGGKVNLGDLTTLDLVLRAHAAPLDGRVDLQAFELRAGPVVAQASARVAGLPRGEDAFDPAVLEVREGTLTADADLGRLVASLSRFVDLGGTDLEGRLTVRSTADGAAGAVAGRFDVGIDGLHVVSPAPDGGDGPGTELSVPRLTAGGKAGADERGIRLDELVVHWDALRAAGLDVPTADVGLTAAYALEDGVLDVEEWTLDSPLANGGGHARVAGLSAADAGPTFAGSVSLRGDVEPWRALLAGLVPDLAPARARGAFDLELTADHEGSVSRIAPTLALTGVALDGYVRDGTPLPLPDTDAHLGAKLELDTDGEGLVRVPTLTLRAPGLDVTAKAEVLGLAGLAGLLEAASGADGAASGGTGTPTAGAGSAPGSAGGGSSVQFAGFWTADPGELGRRLAVVLGGPTLSGERLDGNLALRLADGRTDATGRIAGPLLVVDLPADGETPARHIEQRDLDLAFDVSADLGAGDRLEIRSASVSSTTARASVTGTVDGLQTPAEQSADVRFDLSTSLAQALADLGPLLPLEGWTAEGALTLAGSLAGDAGRLVLDARTGIDDLRVVVPPSADAGPEVTPTVIADARWEIDAKAALDTEPLDLEIEQVDVRTSVLHGRLTGRALGLRALLAADAEGSTEAAVAGASRAPPSEARFAPLDGDFRYVPSRLGALLSPWLPGTLTGDREEALVFHVEGPVAGFDPLALLGSLSADATLGLGQLGLPPGLAAGGTVQLASSAGRAHVTGGLSLNGGRLDLDATLDARPEGGAGGAQVSTLHLALDAVQLNQELASVLAHVHPLFAGGQGDELATVSGLLAGGLDVTWSGPLPVTGEATDWLALLGRSLSATGRLRGDRLALSGSPLLSDMLGRFGVPATKELSIAPIDFAVKEGRLSYAEPWVWRVSGTETQFTGSVGLDLSLDLAWRVPVTEQLIAKHGFLKSLAGEAISIPITGTVSAPRLEWDGALKDLAERAARAELERKAKDKLGGLGGLLGGDAGGGKDGQGGAAGPAQTPEALLAAADKAWEEGRREEARALYQEIIDKHKLTMVYALNKKRIKDRAGD